MIVTVHCSPQCNERKGETSSVTSAWHQVARFISEFGKEADEARTKSFVSNTMTSTTLAGSHATMWFRWMSTLLKVITIFNKFIGSRSRRFRIANTIGVDDFQGGVKKDYNSSLSTFHFPQKDENSSANGIRRKRFGQNRTSRKGPTMRQNIVLSDFEERRVFYFPPICVSFSYFLPHHRKWSLFKICIFIISQNREMTFWEVLIFDVAPSTKTTFQKVLIFMVWYFRNAEKSVLTCVIVPLQSYFAEYLSGNCARDIYFFAEPSSSPCATSFPNFVATHSPH